LSGTYLPGAVPLGVEAWSLYVVSTSPDEVEVYARQYVDDTYCFSPNAPQTNFVFAQTTGQGTSRTAEYLSQVPFGQEGTPVEIDVTGPTSLAYSGFVNLSTYYNYTLGLDLSDTNVLPTCGAVPPSVPSGGGAFGTSNGDPVNNIPVTSPLVLNFTGGPIQFLGQPVPFDFFWNGSGQLLDWLAPQFAFLAWDPEGTGQITTGAQLFGTVTPLANGPGIAANGFSGLAQYDLNQDGVINGDDAIFGQLVAWFDTNSNGVSDPGEVSSIRSLGVIAIPLAYATLAPPASGSYVGEDGAFGYQSSTGTAVSGEIADVYFPTSF
jgi:hypothetical protein